jgi:hypothetical protein
MYVCMYANSKSPTNDSYMVHIKRHIGSNIAMKINIQKVHFGFSLNDFVLSLHIASATTRYVACIPVNTKFLIFQNPRPINMNPSTNIYPCPRRTQLILLHREAISSQDWQDVCMYIGLILSRASSSVVFLLGPQMHSARAA